jgi:hypothetical protein
VDRGVGSGEFQQNGHEPFSFSQASRCVVAAVVVVVAVGGTGRVVGAATEIGGEEDGGECEGRIERMEGLDKFRLRLRLINPFRIDTVRVDTVRVRWKVYKDDFTLTFIVFGPDDQKTSTPNQTLLPSFRSELEKERESSTARVIGSTFEHRRLFRHLNQTKRWRRRQRRSSSKTLSLGVTTPLIFPTSAWRAFFISSVPVTRSNAR